MAEIPDDEKLQRLGLYDPNGPGADDMHNVLRIVFDLGATLDEVTGVGPLRLGPLALDLAMRPPGPTDDLDTFAETSGFDPSLVRKVWAALGLPESGPVRVTPDAAEALRLLVGMSSWLQPDTTLAMARVMGSACARLAEALSNAFRVEFEVPERQRGTTYTRAIEGSLAAAELLPLFLQALTAVFRRHLIQVSYNLWSIDDEGAAVTLERTVGFADLVSSTEAVRAASAGELARTVREFEARVWELVAGVGGRVVKLIGDEAMFVIEDPAAACEVAERLIEESPQAVRVGLAQGTVVALYGDYYGETVNLAARLVRAADASTVAASSAVRNRVSSGFSFDALPEQELKGFGEPVVFFRVSRR
ncbi:MAG: hypothetical protein JO148_12635 [Acidimicrobiia bacterium]|nr:hypothetical protein [Acidimicrobiia bacterium]